MELLHTAEKHWTGRVCVRLKGLSVCGLFPVSHQCSKASSFFTCSLLSMLFQKVKALSKLSTCMYPWWDETSTQGEAGNNNSSIELRIPPGATDRPVTPSGLFCRVSTSDKPSVRQFSTGLGCIFNVRVSGLFMCFHPKHWSCLCREGDQ